MDMWERCIHIYISIEIERERETESQPASHPASQAAREGGREGGGGLEGERERGERARDREPTRIFWLNI